MSEKPPAKEFITEEKALAIIRAFSNPRDVDDLRAFIEKFDIPKSVFTNSVLQRGIEQLTQDLLEPFGANGPDQETRKLISFLRETFSLYIQ